MNINNLINHLKNSYKPTDKIAYDIGTEEDIYEHAIAMDINLTDDEISRILKRINYNKDASIGINWDVIESYIKDVVLERQQKITTIIYGGTKRQIIQQQTCEHEWGDLCIDSKSRYVKCKKCFCIERDISEKKYYKEMGLSYFMKK